MINRLSYVKRCSCWTRPDPQTIETVPGTDGVSVTRNNSLLNAAGPRPDNGGRGIRCIVCEEGSPVCGGAHAEVPSRNGPLGNQLKCSLSRSCFPLGFCSGTRLVHHTDRRGQRRAPARGLLLHHRPLSLSPKACSCTYSLLLTCI